MSAQSHNSTGFLLQMAFCSNARAVMISNRFSIYCYAIGNTLTDKIKSKLQIEPSIKVNRANEIAANNENHQIKNKKKKKSTHNKDYT